MGVVGDAVFEDEVDVFDVSDFLAGITVDNDEVSSFARFQCADAVAFSEEFGAILRGDVNSFERRKAGFHEQLSLALIAKTGEHAAVPGGIFTRKKQASSFDEVPLKFHFFLEQNSTGAIPLGYAGARGEIVRAGRKRERLQHAVLQGRAVGSKSLEDNQRGSDGDALLHQVANHGLDRFAGNFDFFDTGMIVGGGSSFGLGVDFLMLALTFSVLVAVATKLYPTIVM